MDQFLTDKHLKLLALRTSNTPPVLQYRLS